MYSNLVTKYTKLCPATPDLTQGSLDLVLTGDVGHLRLYFVRLLASITEKIKKS
jgi:hypothetical protein